MSDKYYVVLTGAKINFGDYLITHRAIELLKKNKPNYEFIKMKNWISLDDKIKYINKSKGIIILGGPGYQIEMYPKVFKLTEVLSDITVPISYLGGGWYGKSNSEEYIENYVFSNQTKELLNRMYSDNACFSVRDIYTKKALEINGFKDILVTGCPVWYNFSENKVLKKDLISDTMIFSAPEKKMYYKQFLRLLEYFRKSFPTYQLIVTFNRGIGDKPFVSSKAAKNTKNLANKIRDMGIEVLDISGDLSGIKAFYRAGFHIGYRVHSHILSLSLSIPSILIHEDGRGNGVTDTLFSLGLDGYKLNKLFVEINKIVPKQIRKYSRWIFRETSPINNVSETIREIYDTEVRSNYKNLDSALEKIEQNYVVMKKYIEVL